MKSVKYLTQVREKFGLKSDAALAEKLDLSKGGVSMYLSGKRIMDDETCGKVAYHLNIDPMLVVAAACIDRAEKTGQKSIWEVFMSRMAATAASVVLGLLVVLSGFAPSNVEAADGSKTSLSAKIRSRS